MIIDVRNEKVVYITIGDTMYYIDDSTGEQIFEKFAPITDRRED